MPWHYFDPSISGPTFSCHDTWSFIFRSCIFSAPEYGNPTVPPPLHLSHQLVTCQRTDTACHLARHYNIRCRALCCFLASLIRLSAHCVLLRLSVYCALQSSLLHSEYSAYLLTLQVSCFQTDQVNASVMWIPCALTWSWLAYRLLLNVWNTTALIAETNF